LGESSNGMARLSWVGPEVLFETCVAMKIVDDDDDDDGDLGGWLNTETVRTRHKPANSRPSQY